MKKKILFIIALAAFVFTCSLLFINRPSDMLTAVKKEADATEVLKVIPLNNENDCLCIYKIRDGSVGIAYLDCKGNDRYRQRLFFNELKENVSYKFSAADSDLEINFKFYHDPYALSESEAEKSEFTVDNSKYYLLVSPVFNKKIIFYSSYSFDMNYLHETVDDLVTSMQNEASSQLGDFVSNFNNILS